MRDTDSKRKEEAEPSNSFSETRRTLLKSISAVGAGGIVASEVEPAEAHEREGHLARTPPMGWNSWNHFHCDIDAEMIKETADAMVESGMKDAGYEYINIDDCWMAPERDADGNLQPDPETFPNGIDAVADYVHDRGLKLGIYSSAGTLTCQQLPASLGYEERDARSFAEWGVDYLKYDNCYNQGVDPLRRYGAMGEALRQTDRDIVYSLCCWGQYDVEEWGPDVGGHLWRTTGDITDSWPRVMDLLDQQVGLAEYAGPGHWNDPDMLEVGNSGLSTRESRAHFSLWCILAAPLLAGNDLRDMDEETRNILTNEEVLAIDQDPAGIQGTKRKDTGDHEVWAKPLGNGDVAVCLLNRGDATGTISIDVDEFDLANASAYILRDLWGRTEVATANAIRASVPSHGVALYRVRPGTPDEAPPATTLSVETDDVTLVDGEVETVTTSFTNDGRLAVEDVELSFEGPEGWDVSAETPPTHDNVAPSKSVETAWNVDVPEDTTPGRYDFTLEAAFVWGDDDDAHTTETIVSFEAPLDPLPDGYSTFASTDARFGSIEENDTLVVEANGEDVYASDDEYGALYDPDARAAQNSSAVVKVRSQEDTHDWAKAGLMVRNDITGAGASPGYAIVAVTPGNGFAFQHDGDADGYLESNVNGGDVSYPVRLKVERDGDTVAGSYSVDGESWTEIGSADLPEVADTQDVGMFACSHTDGSLCQVEFDEFSVSNESGVTLSPTGDDLVPRDETAELAATFTNYRRNRANDLEFELQAPDGWSASATSGTSVGEVAAGESFTATWEVTAPADAESGDHGFTATATYAVDGTARSAVGSTSLSVPPVPPTGDTHLSDHEWVDATIGWGDIGLDESVEGNAISIGGTTYDKGLGTHAESEIEYYLGGNVSRFVADVGVDDEVDNEESSVRFRVVGDGDVLAETAVLGVDAAPVPLDVDVAGIDMLTLEVADAGDSIDYDHADWAAARVLE